MSFAAFFSSDDFSFRPLLRLTGEDDAYRLRGEEIVQAGFGGVILAGSTPDATRAAAWRAHDLSVWMDVSALPAPREEWRGQQLAFDDLQPRFETASEKLDTMHPQSAPAAIEILEALGDAISGVFFDAARRTGSTPNPPFPWSDSLPARFAAHAGFEVWPRLSQLVSSGEDAALLRQCFWDEIHRAREDHFSAPLRRWCHERNLPFCARDFRPEYHALALDTSLRARLDGAAVALKNHCAFPASLAAAPGSVTELHRLLHAGALAFERAPRPHFGSAPEVRLNEIIARHAALFAASKPAAKIGVLFPARSCRTHYHPQGHRLTRWVGEDLQRTTNLLDELHFDWLFVQEDQLIAAPQDGSTLQLGAQQHELEVIVVPSLTALSWAAWEKLETFVEKGGKVACLGLLPRWSERGRDRQLELHVGKTTRSVVADLYDAYTALENGTELPPTIGYPIFREYHSGGRLCCYQPRLNADADDARLRVRQILRESLAPDFETLAPEIRYSQRLCKERDFFFISNAGEQTHLVNARLHPRQSGGPVELDAAHARENPLFVFMPYAPEEGGGLGLSLELAAGQARCIAFDSQPRDWPTLVRANFEIESIESGEAPIVTGSMPQSGAPQVAVHRDGKNEWRFGEPVTLPAPLLLDSDEWSEADFSGGREYSQRQTIPEEWRNCRVFLEAALPDFSVQCLVNGQTTPIKIAPPLRFAVTALLACGQSNTFALKVWTPADDEAMEFEAPFARLVAYPLVQVKITA